MKRASKLNRPSLVIEVPGEECLLENQPLNGNIVRVRPLNSTKNEFEMQQNQFKPEKGKHQPRKMSFAMAELQEEREELISSITILKNSAVSALAEKSDQIERMRSMGLEHTQDYADIYNELCSQKQLSETHFEWEEEYMKERNLLIADLREKEATIDKLLELI